MQKLHLSSVLTSGPVDPQPTKWTIEHNYLVRLVVSPAGSTDVPITPALLVAACPGGSTTWQQLRVQKISVYAPAAADGYVRVTIGSNLATGIVNPVGDGKIFDDYGTQGAKRPQVHIIPNLALREFWWNDIATDENPIFSVNHGSAGQLLVYCTLQLRSVVRAP